MVRLQAQDRRAVRLALAADELTKTPDPQPEPSTCPLLLGSREIAGMLGCSVRHIRRLLDTGRIPKPLRLGSLLRWRKTDIEEWVNEGCPAPRKG